MTRSLAALAGICCLYLMPAPVPAQDVVRTSETAAGHGRVLKIGTMTWTEIDALSRDSTLFLLAVGILEEHGPHLPIATDQIGVEHEAGEVARRLSRALPGWNVVLMPPVDYGSAGANHIGRMPVHPGTYGIRQSTLRSLIADIGGQIAQNRFRWVFVMNGHAAPTHNIAVNDACDFVSETFGVTMLNVSGLFKADSLIQAQGARVAARQFSPSQLAAIGVDPHAGVGETSGVLALRPDLVRPGYRTLPSNRVGTLEEMRDIAERPGWLGYFSAPSMASAAYGRDIEAWWVEGLTALILQAVRGENLRDRPRYPGGLRGDARASLVDEVLVHEREFERKLDQWLSRRGNR